MPYDFKREYRALYQAKSKPSTVDVPPMTFVATTGSGDPNQTDGAYQAAIELLYAFSYTVKMSKKSSWQPEGYFDYVVAPLEGLWWAGAGTFNGSIIANKSQLSWVSLIRQPDFVTPAVFDHVCSLVAQKKPQLSDALSAGKLRLVRFSEGLCAQVMHVGSYDEEAKTIALLDEFIASQNLEADFTAGGESPHGHLATTTFDGDAILDGLNANGGTTPIRLHHEIYLSDPRKIAPERLKTVIRHPVRLS